MGKTYSTCTIDQETCPDKVCDPLEKLDPIAICPQDCCPKGEKSVFLKFQLTFVADVNVLV